MGGRFALLIGGIFLAYSALGFNIYMLQIDRGAFYSAKAESQVEAKGLLAPRRGNIYFVDKNNNYIPAAVNKPYPIIFAVPKEIKDAEFAAKTISEILNLDAGKISKALSKPDDLYELLAAKVSADAINNIKQTKIRGIYTDVENFRFYPFGELAAQVLGYVGPSEESGEIEGRYGVEFSFNNSLAGTPGRIENEKLIEPIHGENVILTIDRNIEARSEEILADLVKKFDAVAGTVIVQEPQTGKILAMGNYPNFNPNEYFNYKISSYLNPAVQAVYEPGSIMKVVTMAAGIDSGKITPETKYNDAGSVKYNGRTIKNWDLKAHGTVTMTEVIEKSINTGAVFAERKTGHDIFYNYLLNFGFNKLTGIELPGEVSGSLRSLEKNVRDINFATASFGQGVSVTPIGLINAISVIANGGNLMKPYIIEGTEPRIVRRVISQETAKQVTKMMTLAVYKAQIAQIPNYEIAGKTGTAYIPDFKNGGYSDEVIHTFVGFAPATKPRFAILIKIEKPKEAPLAGLTVVPTFRELAEFMLNYYNIAPDSNL